MSDQTDYSTDDDNQEEHPQGSKNWRRQLEEEREQARTEAQTLRSELDNLRRDQAFRSAGLNPDNKLHSLVMKGYEGDLNPEAIKSFAEEAGVFQTQTPANTDAVQAHARMDRASQDAAPVPPVGSDDANLDKLLSMNPSNASYEDFIAQAKAMGVAHNLANG